MTQLIVLGHGHFATGLQSAVEQIIGFYPNCAFFDFPSEKTPEQLEKEINNVLSGKSKDENILFCCDILGGTPFRIASLMQQHYPNMEVVVGTNLQMLLEVIMALSDVPFEQLITLSFESGKRGITSLKEQLSHSNRQKISSNDEGI